MTAGVRVWAHVSPVGMRTVYGPLASQFGSSKQSVLLRILIRLSYGASPKSGSLLHNLKPQVVRLELLGHPPEGPYGTLEVQLPDCKETKVTRNRLRGLPARLLAQSGRQKT